MESFTAMKLKRKDLEDVSDDFSDFSLSSPARKIRRLDIELPPIMEEEEPAASLGLFAEHPPQVRNSGLIIEELPSEPENEERAIVLFKSMDTPLMQSPSDLSLSVSPDLILRIKNQIWSSKSIAREPAEDESSIALHATNRNECLAVVPWAPSKIPSAPETEVSHMMDAEDMEVDAMDIEVENASVDQRQAGVSSSVMNTIEGLPQWQQQHCLIPQLSQSTSTPVVWFR